MGFEQVGEPPREGEVGGADKNDCGTEPVSMSRIEYLQLDGSRVSLSWMEWCRGQEGRMTRGARYNYQGGRNTLTDPAHVTTKGPYFSGFIRLFHIQW